MEWAKRINSAYFHKDSNVISRLRGAWAAAMANLHHDKTNGIMLWESVRGPASACIATLGRIGWDVHISNAWRVWMDRNGYEIDLAETPIHSLKQHLVRDIATALWTQSAFNQGIQDELSSKISGMAKIPSCMS